ncbi:hypothetical protein LOZ58_003148 [Ophidiomyces ophidiicola]|nr:hypothetical protein LOZ58_003148 [Ophidiomyces ophidiicola]
MPLRFTLHQEMTEGTASSPGLEPQKVLVFGATGLIGSKILRALVAIKAHLESIAVFTSPTTLEKKPEFLDYLKNEGIRVITGNLNNEDDIRRAYQGICPSPMATWSDFRMGLLTQDKGLTLS